MDKQTKETLNIVGQVMKDELGDMKELIEQKTNRVEHSRLKAHALNTSILDYVREITTRKSVMTQQHQTKELPSYFKDMN